MSHLGTYATKDQLDAVVSKMYESGITYSKAVREFKRQFTIAVLRETRGNKLRAAEQLGVHRNTVNRIVAELEIDVSAIRRERRAA